MRHLFLKGNSGVGKTTLLLECITPYRDQIGGFLSQRLVSREGETKGFCLVPIKEAFTPTKLYDKAIPNIFIELTASGYVKRPEVFDDVGILYLQEAKDKKLCFMDEIGGIELCSEIFQRHLYEFLHSKQPILGVLKCERNYATMGTRISLKSKNEILRNELESKIIDECQGEILEFDQTKKNQMETHIRDFLKNYCNPSFEKEWLDEYGKKKR